MSFSYVSVTTIDADQLVGFVLCPLNFLADQADDSGSGNGGGSFMGGRRLAKLDVGCECSSTLASWPR